VRRTAGLSFIVCLAAALAGCAVGPRYTQPRPLPGSQGPLLSAGPAANAVADPPPDRWWRLYQDPLLDSLVSQALTENRDLKVAAANLAYAQGVLSEARAGRFPGTEISAGGPAYGRSATQLAAGLGASTGYTATFSASYQVDLFGRIRRTIEAARANLEATRMAEDVTRVTVAAQTADAYAQVCGLGEQISVARNSIDVLQKTYDLTKVQRDVGALSDFDLDRQGGLLDQAKAALPPLEGQRRAALFALAALIGRTPAQAPTEAAACSTPPQLARPLPTGDGQALLRRRPDVRQSERLLASATARIGVAAADLYPTISLGGSVTQAGALAGGGGSGLTYSVGPFLSWTFPNILVARARVQQAGAQASAALASFDQTVLGALRDTESALSTYGAELRRHEALLAAQAQARDALRLAHVQFEVGGASFLDLLTAETASISADQALAQSDQAMTADQVAVFQQLGGGWEQAPAVSPMKLTGR
jgi:NodT family efflux transporter outer membrane factor (OMF) lipoprotein